ncbi:hypothetical protein BDZ89DRAFT_341917 [Hymenopellis radicata]|nr:hypothetical protein BDZ89DRAFT_341917 [Hymenopellis radicata]
MFMKTRYNSAVLNSNQRRPVSYIHPSLSLQPRRILEQGDKRDRLTLEHLMALFLLCVGVLSVFAPLYRVYAAAPTVDLGYTTYRGAHAANIFQFRYAAPPVSMNYLLLVKCSC